MEIQKPGDENTLYRSEIQRGAKIFDECFQGVKETKNFPQKKAEYEKGLEESLHAMKDAAEALHSKELIQINRQLDQDVHTYLNTPSDENAKKVEKDLDSLRKST